MWFVLLAALGALLWVSGKVVSFLGAGGIALFCGAVLLSAWLTALCALKLKRLRATAGSLIFPVIFSGMGLVNFASADGTVDAFGITRESQRRDPGDPPEPYVRRSRAERRLNNIGNLFLALFSVHNWGAWATAAIAALPSIYWYRRNKKEYVHMESGLSVLLGALCFGLWLFS